jgi:hypothetical protein
MPLADTLAAGILRGAQLLTGSPDLAHYCKAAVMSKVACFGESCNTCSVPNISYALNALDVLFACKLHQLSTA